MRTKEAKFEYRQTQMTPRDYTLGYSAGNVQACAGVSKGQKAFITPTLPDMSNQALIRRRVGPLEVLPLVHGSVLAHRGPALRTAPPLPPVLKRLELSDRCHGRRRARQEGA